jgi:hypothetical protein
MPATLPTPGPVRKASRSQTMGFGASSIHQVQFHNWVEEEEADELTKAKSDFSLWLSAIAKNELLFERHVYKNPNLSDLDLHQHRSLLFGLLSFGERLIVAFYKLGAAKSIDPSNYFKLIQQNLDSLLESFNAWHGPLEAQEDIPEEFVEGIRDIAEGKIVDLDKALNEKPDDAVQV